MSKKYDPNMFRNVALERKRCDLAAKINGAHASGIINNLCRPAMESRPAPRLNARGVAGILRFNEICGYLTRQRKYLEADYVKTNHCISMMPELMCAVLYYPGDLALYAELDVMLDEMLEGVWFHE